MELFSRDAVYTERANGRQEYWTYSDGQRIYVSPTWVARQMKRGSVKLIEVTF